MLALDLISLNLHDNPMKSGATIIPLVQVSKLRHRGLRLLARGTQAVNGGGRF